MRIAIDTRKYTDKDSGIGSYTCNLVRALLEEDKDFELLLVCSATRGLGKIRDPRVKHLYFPGHPISPLTRFGLGAYLRRQAFDVFHAPFEVVPRAVHKPLVVTVHDLNWLINPHYNCSNRLLGLANGIFYRQNLIAAMQEAHRILAVSHATRHAIIEYAPWYASKTRVTYNGMDHERIYPLETAVAYRILAPFMKVGTPFVLTVGQGSPYKNHLNAVRGFMEAFGDRPDYRLILVCRSLDHDKRLQELLHSPWAQAHVLTLPYVTPEVLNALYNAARMVLHPSYYEGFGLPLLEAMAVGTPVVTSNVSAMPEVAGPAALLVDPADYRAIAKALVTLDQDETLRSKLVSEGHKRLKHFSWRNCAHATLKVYRELADPPGRSGKW